MVKPLLLTVLALTAAHAQPTLTRWDSTLELHPDASLRVHETFTLLTDTPHLVRTLPPDLSPHSFTLRTLDGQPHPFHVDARSIRFDVPDTSPLTLVLSYTARPTLTDQPTVSGHALLLRWIAPDPRWTLDVTDPRLTLVFPQPLDSSERTLVACSEATVRWPRPDTCAFTVDHLRAPWTLDVVVPQRMVRRPSSAERLSAFLTAHRAALWFVLIPLALWVRWGLARFRAWYVTSATPLHSELPPRGLSPLDVGTLVDGSPDPIDCTGQLVDLARRGHVRASWDGGLRLHGVSVPDGAESPRVLWYAVFDRASVVRPAELRAGSPRAWAKVRRWVWRSLYEKGLWRSPRDPRQHTGLGWVFLAALAEWGLAAWTLAQGGATGWWETVWVAVAVCAAAVASATWGRTGRAGAAVLALGFAVVGCGWMLETFQTDLLRPWLGVAWSLGVLGVLGYAASVEEGSWTRALTDVGVDTLRKLRGFERALEEGARPGAAVLGQAIALGLVDLWCARAEFDLEDFAWLGVEEADEVGPKLLQFVEEVERGFRPTEGRVGPSS